MKPLSLCLVGRDAAEHLPSLLQSASDLSAQLCFVDTGSTDGTPTRLQEAGAAVAQVDADLPLHEANNRCLDLATGSWILWLRPGERLSPELRQAVAATVADANLGSGCCAIRQLLPEGQALMYHDVRLYRRDPAIRFSALRPDNLDDVILAMLQRGSTLPTSLPGTVDDPQLRAGSDPLHDGRETPRERWQQVVRRQPEDLFAWTRLLEQARRWDDSQLLSQSAPEALEAVQRCASDSLRQTPFAGELLVLIAAGLHPEAHKPALLFLDPDAPQEALDFLLPWAERIAPSAAYQLRCGELRELVGGSALEAAAQNFDQAIGLRATTLYTHLATVRPLLGLARVGLGLQQPDEALRFLNLALGEAPRDPEALLALTTLSRTLGGEQGAKKVVDAYVETYGDAPELHGALGEAALRAGDTRTAVSELQLAVGDQAQSSPYAGLLDEALLSAL